ncbi:hypothetical protein K488DRAFT_61159 [Vararia minispora EC-137]|uniref:Uncharacterized protein n=1 Tax=Vararia minispora EC-137 TaxID=1314806 RepID=A0ACB8Q7B0_9AGAM|nr:hypothetical protein K488DRAFT_61159 [Vararia minispora EC-137]
MLHDVTASEVDALLSIIYPSNFHRRDMLTVAEWFSVLRLATRWGITSIRSFVLEILEDLATPLDKLVIARQFDIPGWLKPAYVSLCLRKESLSIVEGQATFHDRWL